MNIRLKLHWYPKFYNNVIFFVGAKLWPVSFGLIEIYRMCNLIIIMNLSLVKVISKEQVIKEHLDV